MSQACVFVVDDDPMALRYLRTILELQSHVVVTAGSGIEGVERIENGLCPDIVFLDVMMPGMDGLETLRRMRKVNPHLRAIMVSCMKDIPKVVEAMHLGATDYLTKPVDGAAVEQALKRYLPQQAPPPSELGAEIDENVEELADGNFFAAVSPAMQKVRAHIGQIAGVDVPVLLLGESGTGKEVAAMLIHKLSQRAKRRFVKVNCAAIPSELLESELFGYEAGAFTGATTAHPGKFEQADHGTILLDEIGEMPPSLQAKLLQVAQDHKFFRLGARSPVSVDVRILAATNINITEAIKSGKLRLDLYYRLNAFSIQMPALRQRREEVPVLMKLFMSRLAQRFGRPARPFSNELLNACMRHFWPGNIRELQNFVKRYLILGDEASLLSELKSGQQEVAKSVARTDGKDLKELVRALKGEAEAQVIQAALEQTNWNRREAAQMLNISYKALAYKTRQYGLESRRPSSSSADSKDLALPA
ncbi:MAG: sigma-54-dependent transcriptional regulator [Terriglobales bacterium]